MKNLKKSLVFLMVFAMVLSTVAPVFAATPTDVIGTDYEDAVGKLVALGILEGYPDGTFAPEKSITRAEFSKIACYILGLQSAADLSKGTTRFKDVAGTHWASGFINMATEKGLLKGYPDGTFKPENNVSYSEAITILVRAIGLGPVVEVKGTWPANYLAKAAEVGITDDIGTFDGKQQAIRGMIAELSWNTLTAEKWGAASYDSEGPVSYEGLGVSLLKEKYKNFVDANGEPKFYEDVEVTATQLAGALDANEVTIENEDLKDEGPFDANGVLTTKVNIEDFDANAIFGKKINVLLGKDNKIVYAKVDSTSVIEGLVEEFDKVDDKVTVDGKEYTFASDANIYLNTKSYAVSAFDTMADVVGDCSAKATIVLDSGKISAMNLFVADVIAPVGVTMKQFIVKEIKANGEVRNVAASSTAQFDLDDVTADADKVVIVKNGESATKDDIKAGDAVTYIKNGSLYYIVVSDTEVTGTLTKITDDVSPTGESYVRKKLTVDGKTYEMVNDNSVLMTKTGSLEDATAMASTVNDYYKKEVTLQLNAIGEIIVVSAAVKSSATLQYGVVTRDIWEGNPDAEGETTFYIQILTIAGEKKAFAIKGEEYNTMTGDELDEVTDNNEVKAGTALTPVIAPGSTVLYDVTSDGKIDASRLYDITNETINDSEEDVYAKVVDFTETVAIKDDTKKITVGTTSYFADSNTAYLNCKSGDMEMISDWGKLVAEDRASDTGVEPANNITLDDAAFYLVYDENNMIKLIIVDVDPATYQGSTAKYGIFVESGLGEEDPFITLYINGEEVTYTVADGVYDQSVSNSVYFVEQGDLVRFELDGEGEFDGAEPGNNKGTNFRVDISVIADNEADADKIDSVNTTSRIITFEASKTRDGQDLSSAVLASDVVVYDVRDGGINVGSIGDLEAGQFVVVDDYDASDDVFGVVVICE